MALANSWLTSPPTMRATRGVARYRSHLRRHSPLIRTALTFQQWLLRKYRWRPERVFVSPALVFRRVFHPVTTPSWHHVTSYLLHIALTLQVAQHQSGPRTTPQGAVWSHLGLPSRPMILLAGTPMQQTALAADGRHDGIMAISGASFWTNQPGPWRPSVHTDAFSVSSLTYQQMQEGVPPELGRFAGRMEGLQARLGASDGHLRSQPAQHPAELSHPRASALTVTKAQMLHPSAKPEVRSLLLGQPTEFPFLPIASQAPSITHVLHQRGQRFTELLYLMPSAISFTMPKMIARLVRHAEGSTSIDDAPRPTEFPIWQPAALTLARPEVVPQPLRREGSATSVEQPLTGVQSLTTMSGPPSLDISRLTDQVYHVLERKIRLEKQRRGYR
jgi:hypothetical protein